MKKKVYLSLENGKVLQGYRFGADGDVTGELVFTTGMVGYDKTITDPAYYGQIVVQTFPLIGNYGIIESELESKTPCLSALVVREYCEVPSNFRTEETLDAYMKRHGIVGIYGIDTRELARIIRDCGTVNAKISNKPVAAEALASYKITGAVFAMGAKETSVYNEDAKKSVALLDFGAKESSVRFWAENGLKVIRMPACSSAEDVLALNTDGIVLSEGPGNPAENTQIIETIRALVGKKPIFAVGLGMQMLAIASGAKTCKMKHGHRGANQPVKYCGSGKIYVSSQNHGYEVVKSSVSVGTIDFINVNDGGVEGIRYENGRAISVQFSPESCSAALEPNFLVEDFNKLLTEGK
jgi:carbamoyl-phosphate synthase small subunit